VVIPVIEDRASPAEDAIHRARDPSTQRSHAAAERLLALGFDQEMDVVSLDRVLDQPEGSALGGGAEGALDLTDEPAIAQGGQTSANADGCMARRDPREGLPTEVRHRRLSPIGLSTCSGAPPTPASHRLKIERELTTAPHSHLI
jgi:hypothetical protein